MQIIVTRPVSDLETRIWVFELFTTYTAPRLVLDEYRVETRASKRHKPTVTGRYRRIQGAHYRGLTQDEVPLPSDVQAQAKQQLLGALTIGYDL